MGNHVTLIRKVWPLLLLHLNQRFGTLAGIENTYSWDTCFVPGKSFGPVHFSRHDLAVQTVMRGRDHGLPDYQTVRRSFNLPNISHWADINPTLYRTNPQVS